ncbi:TonB-dependent siderophore receptor [Nostoc sp.]|uniref:TonB-dependent siderophore receptor n=1 Tax=Nostoc sp. TaxID=1180 RepID=UPI003FA5E7AF
MAQSVRAVEQKNQQAMQGGENSNPTTTKIKRLSEISRPVRNVKQLVSQLSTPETAPTTNEIVQVTGVKANPTAQGVEVILQTRKGQQLQVTNRSAGNSFIADIPNAQLRLPSGEAFRFRSQKPIAGISEITVTNFDANTIRVTAIGEASLPTVELSDSADEGLIFSVASVASSAPSQQAPQTPQKPQAGQPGSQTQPSLPSAQSDEPIELVVTGEQDGYRVPDASTATKTDTPLRDIPQSIQVVPRQVLQDQQVTNLGEALRNVPGLAQGPNSASRGQFSVPAIRGFDAGSNIFRDGLRDPTTAYVVPDVAGIEQIEVLKGPGSVLYGQGSLGGVINLVTKKPLSNPFYSAEFSVGSFNLYRGAIDLSGSLNDSKTILYRLNAAAQTTESFLDFYDEQKYFVAPVLSWQISDRTKLTLQAEYVNRPKKNGQSGIPAIGSVLPNPNGEIPRDRNISEPDSTDDQRSFRVGYDLEHRFNDNWQLRNAFSATWLRRERNFIISTALAPDNRTLSRGINLGGDDQRFYNVDTYLVGKFATGSIQHQLVTGFNLTREESVFDITRRQAASLDVFNPVYRQPLGSVTSRTDEADLTDTLGIYVQDQVTLADNMKLLLGLRFDTFKQTVDDRISNTNQEQSDHAFSPRVGIVYQPIPPISLYASYSRAFTPVTGTTFEGSAFQPEDGTQYEVGIKADLSDQLSTTLAFYELTRSNVLTTDPINPDFSIQTGEQRSRGIEFSLAGEILPGWNVIAGYAYTDATITQDNDFPVGNLLNNIPRNSFNIWTSYKIQRGPVRGLGFGMGFFFVSDRQGDLANTFELPSYFRTDAAIFYKRNQFQAAINFKNLFNVDYFESALNRLNVYYGDPFVVQGTISFTF